MKKINLKLDIDKKELREKLDIKDPIPETGEEIIEKLNPIKNSLDFEVLTNIPDFALSKDVIGYRGGEGGGGGIQLTFQDEGTRITDNPIHTLNVTGATGALTYSGNGIATLDITAVSTDEKVKYDVADPTAGYVADKFVGGTGITLSEGTGANENKLEITNTLDLSSYLTSATAATTYVPYTGATGDVNLGVHGLTAADLTISGLAGLSFLDNQITEGVVGGGIEFVTSEVGFAFGGAGANILSIVSADGNKSANLSVGSLTTDQTFTFPDITGTFALGTGTINEIAYWAGANTLGALAVATYPSLTELSYVKGLSSAVQTQIGGKQPQLNGTGFVKATGTTISYDNSTYLTSVTAHDLLSATHGDTTAGAVARGDLITGQGATPKWVKLAIGTSGKVLISDGTDIGWSASALGTAAYTASTAYAAALGLDDNYVTDAQLIVIGNTSGANTGDNATNSQYSGLITNATHTGDATGSGALTVVALNGTNLAALGTGILKNTTTTGVPSIAIAADFPTLNQSTTGSAATLTTTRTIWGQNFNGSANVTGTLALGASDVTLTGSIGSTGARATKVWTAALESTAMPTVGGTALLSSLTAPQFTTIELGAAADTTLSRVSAGVIAVEGKTIPNLTDGGTFAADISVPDEVYSSSWNGSVEVPTKNAVYDKIEGKIVFASFTNLIYAAQSEQIGGYFSGNINGAPTATSVVYDGDSGERNIRPYPGVTVDGRIRLYNVTRGTYRKITAVDEATNTITTESSVDSWADNDVLTTESQVVATFSGTTWQELDVSAHVPANATAIYLEVTPIDSGGGNGVIRFHPNTSSTAQAKIMQVRTQVAAIGPRTYVWVPVIDQKIAIGCVSFNSGAGFTFDYLLRTFGYMT